MMWRPLDGVVERLFTRGSFRSTAAGVLQSGGHEWFGDAGGDDDQRAFSADSNVSIEDCSPAGPSELGTAVRNGLSRLKTASLRALICLDPTEMRRTRRPVMVVVMPSATPRLNSLTGVRFFAAAAVFGHHSGLYAADGEFDSLAAGMIGVSLFYILSGFVMSWTAREGDSMTAFYGRRFARIYPVFVVAWLISLGVNYVAGTAKWTDLVAPTLLQSWFPWREVYFAGNAVFWSLSVEAFFYFVFPFLHRLIGTRGSRVVVLIMIGAGVVSIATAFALAPLPSNDFTRWLAMMFPPLRLLEFIIGMSLGILLRRGFAVRIPLTLAVGLTVAGFVGASFVPEALARFAVTLIPFTMLVWSLARADLSGTWTPFRSRLIVKGGEISYSFYLIHAMGLTMAFSALRRAGLDMDAIPDVAAWGLLIVIFLACQAAAWILHALIETPFEKALRNGWRPAELRAAYARLLPTHAQAARPVRN